MSDKSLDEIIEDAGMGANSSPRSMLPYFIICYLDLENVLDLEQLRVLKGFYEHFLTGELLPKNMIIRGINESGYAFEPMEKKYCGDFPINKEALAWLETMIAEREKAGIETEKERWFLLVLRLIIEVKPYFTARDQILANNVMDFMLLYERELIAVDAEQGKYYMKSRTKRV